ncbi:glycosyltransferase [Vibrio sp. TH_r3]|uniref:glycosyltransferase n=1 Tax=Vibrio sp. TH_r3 TaxID=3082084 RepID=UPI002953DE5F|nr:glycosyltransferase [Vibrio sp. TH_r3]MDV7102883.1 glycosyltransferase [Vibrio sp. TH_r3]
MDFHNDKRPDLIIDCTHLGRHTTGLERITEELFSAEALSLETCSAEEVVSEERIVKEDNVIEKDNSASQERVSLAHSSNRIQHVPGGNIGLMIMQQWFGILIRALRHTKAIVITPGFPPSILLSLFIGKRVIPYIHDLFLLTRTEELNFRAKYYMRPSLAFAVRHLDTFFVNSIKTKNELIPFCKKDAEIITYRPKVRNVFSVENNHSRYEAFELNKLKILMIGTVEPRKNYSGAVRLFTALRQKLGDNIELHIVGRIGWGEDADLLQSTEGIVCHGYASSDTVKDLIAQCSFFLSTSHDEGLGLPLLEVQYGGIAVVASDIEVYREVLGSSGLLIDSDKVDHAVEQIITQFSDPTWLATAAEQSFANVISWNQEAEKDQHVVLQRLKGHKS